MSFLLYQWEVLRVLFCSAGLSMVEILYSMGLSMVEVIYSVGLTSASLRPQLYVDSARRFSHATRTHNKTSEFSGS